MHRKRQDAFLRCVDERYAPDTELFCAICGDGIYPDDEIEWDTNNQICHAECVEKEETWSEIYRRTPFPLN